MSLRPVGFIVPCAPTRRARPPTGPDWLHELKPAYCWRIIAHRAEGAAHLWARTGVDYAAAFPRIAAGVWLLPAGTTLDAEITYISNGKHKPLGRRAPEGETMLVASDLLALNGADWRGRPIEERRAELYRVIAGRDAIVFSQEISGDGAAVYEHARAVGVEYIVSKRRGSSYESGVSRSWVKCHVPRVGLPRFGGAGQAGSTAHDLVPPEPGSAQRGDAPDLACGRDGIPDEWKCGLYR